ncbi:hypothetical protein HPG69_013735 [Diceros bicornis minor]|uniref:Uncharacterized protein n=1 Tax=Diceros bicornis minor TaxID=77932 RepID=A0A7J7FEJ1_DICBM|nr:hypothetical protein HPG69_013735 [Diceros bicornis minor]
MNSNGTFKVNGLSFTRREEFEETTASSHKTKTTTTLDNDSLIQCQRFATGVTGDVLGLLTAMSRAPTLPRDVAPADPSVDLCQLAQRMTIPRSL